MKIKCSIFICFISINVLAGVNEDLLMSVQTGNLESVISTLNKGANANFKANNDRPLLSVAVEEGNIGIVKALIEKGAKVNAIEKNRDTPKWTALMHAVESGNIEIVRFLLAKGANKKQKNGNDYDALYLAELWGHNGIASLLKGEEVKGKKHCISEKILSETNLQKRNNLHLVANEKIR